MEMTHPFPLRQVLGEGPKAATKAKKARPKSRPRPRSVKPQQPSEAQQKRVSKRCALDQDLKDKAARNYDDSLEAQIQGWIEAVTGTAFDEELSFVENLKDGTRLCNILNAYQPGMIKVGRPSKVRKEELSTSAVCS
jgi:hypothetical protein